MVPYYIVRWTMDGLGDDGWMMDGGEPEMTLKMRGRVTCYLNPSWFHTLAHLASGDGDDGRAPGAQTMVYVN